MSFSSEASRSTSSFSETAPDCPSSESETRARYFPSPEVEAYIHHWIVHAGYVGALTKIAEECLLATARLIECEQQLEIERSRQSAGYVRRNLQQRG